ncbi:MAG: FtsX-like permease family protein [Anaerolineales bacterium]
MRLGDLFKLVGTHLARTRFRAALSAFGVVIGTAAIVTLFSLAAGLQQLAAQNLGALGPMNEVTIFSLGGNIGGGGGGIRVEFVGISKANVRKLKSDYLDALAALPGVEALTPVTNFQGQATLQSGSYVAQPNLKGISPSAPADFGYSVDSGVAELGRWQVLVGAKLGESFTDPGIRSGDNRVPRLDLQDQTLTLKLTRTGADGEPVTRLVRLQVAGVLAPRGFDYDYGIFLRLSDVDELNTWSSGQQVNRSLAGFSGATLLVADAKTQSALEQQIRDDGFFTSSPNEILEEINRTYAALQAFVGGVGLITLLIAGTGVANTLITAIFERTAEIGLMKAVGASTRQVMLIFLTEAAAIGGGGGLAGLIVGILFSQIINLVAGQAIGAQLAGPGGAGGAQVNIVATPLWLIVMAPLFAVGIGVIAGLYPARRAASLDPVTALRHE